MLESLGRLPAGELGAVAADELLMLFSDMLKPLAQFGRRRYRLEPLIPRCLILPLAPGPDPVHQHGAPAAWSSVFDMCDVDQMLICCHIVECQLSSQAVLRGRAKRLNGVLRCAFDLPIKSEFILTVVVCHKCCCWCC